MLIKKINYQYIPDSPGVYFFQKGSEILYIGKATSLKDRIRSYFGSDLVVRRGLKITNMIESATTINWKETDSVLEALMLEANLIKKHQPQANTLGKDNKSYNHAIITQEEYPRVILIREHDLKFKENLGFEIKYQFGPFPHGGQLKEALKIIRKIFPFRGEKDFFNKKRRRQSSLNVELGLTPNFSVVSKKEYQKTIRNLKLFFEGKKKSLKKRLETEMKKLAQKQEFEKAQNIRNQIFSLDHIQDIAILKNENKSSLERIEAYDIAHLSETNRVGVMVVIEKGILKKQDYRKFNIRLKGGGDVGALREVLTRRLNRKEWSLPDLIVVDGGKAQLASAQQKVFEFNLKIPVVAVTKDEHHKARSFLGNSEIISKNERDILLANSEAHRFAIKFHREKRGKFLKFV
jgi:excinuclease UvrABC nuclease subunit